MEAEVKPDRFISRLLRSADGGINAVVIAAASLLSPVLLGVSDIHWVLICTFWQFLTYLYHAAFDETKILMFALGNQPSLAAVQPQTIEVVPGYYSSQMPLHISFCGFEEGFQQNHDNNVAVFWMFVWERSWRKVLVRLSCVSCTCCCLFLFKGVVGYTAAQPKILHRIKVLQCFRFLHTTQAIMICRPSYSFITINGSTASIYYNLRILLLNISVCRLLTALCFVYLAEACVQSPVTDHYSSNY